MEAKVFRLLEALVRVRSMLREAEATTAELPRKLQFSHDDSDGWPVLRLRAVDESRRDAPTLKVTGNDKNQIVIHSSFADKAQIVNLDSEESVTQLRDAVVGIVEELLSWIVQSGETSADVTAADFEEGMGHDDIFDNLIDTSDEPVESLPGVKL